MIVKKSDLRLRPMDGDDLVQVFDWRNSDRVRLNMFESEMIPWENHLKWFESLKGNLHSKALMFECRNEIIGVVCAKVVDLAENQWIWGCYLGDKNIFPGAGTAMGILSLEYLFEVLCAKEVIGEMVSANQVSDRFNARIGFKTVLQFTKTTSTGRNIPASLLRQTRQDWISNKDKIFEKYFSEYQRSSGTSNNT